MDAVSYEEAIEHASSLATLCDRLKISGARDDGRMAEERLRGAVEALAYVYGRSPDKVVTDIRACLALDNLM